LFVSTRPLFWHHILNQQWHYVKKYKSYGVQLMWKVLWKSAQYCQFWGLHQGALIIKVSWSSKCSDYQGVLIIKISWSSRCPDHQNILIIKVSGSVPGLCKCPVLHLQFLVPKQQFPSSFIQLQNTSTCYKWLWALVYTSSQLILLSWITLPMGVSYVRSTELIINTVYQTWYN